MTERIDVVTVPDFVGKKPGIFEARTLFFLASWIENAGKSRSFPLHVACIGEPPDSVCWLAERAGARLTVHEPMRLRPGHHLGNKLRGLEIEPETDNVLLLDVDTFVLADLSPMMALKGGIAAAPAGKPRIPEERWGQLFEVCGMDVPQERVPSIAGQVGIPASISTRKRGAWQNREQSAMVPYFNSGVILAPWDCPLRSLWEKTIRQTTAAVDEREGLVKPIHQSDQVGLAVTIQMLIRNGLKFHLLPNRYHATWRHMYGGKMSLRDAAIFHAFGFMFELGNGPITEKTVADAVDSFYRRRLAKVAKVARKQLKQYQFIQYLTSSYYARREFSPLRDLLVRLCSTHVLPAIKACARIAA